MAGRYLGHKIVTMTWIGDGGTSTGAFHEGMNLAAVQKAPLVVVVENNQWAYSTPVARQVPLRDLAERARAYGVASHIVDGNDVAAMLQVTQQAVAQARAGEGPVLIEAKTMRMSGHAQHDPAEYVPREMMDYWKARDPLERCRACLTQNKLWDADTQAALDARVERELTAGAGRRRSLALPAAGNRRARRLLRRLPRRRAALAARQGRSDCRRNPARQRSGKSAISAARRPATRHGHGHLSRSHPPGPGRRDGARSLRRAHRRGHRRLRRRIPGHRRPAGTIRLGTRHRYAHQRNRHRRRRRGHELSRPAPGGRDAVHGLHRLRVQRDSPTTPPNPTISGARRFPSSFAGPPEAACTAARFIPPIPKCISCTRPA